ncbi:isocitrate/isopropylmalate family dehydrogenase [Streptomyces griseoluteus]|uniref:isocitrate/isopropylmalate family dehydrogenase n=1 Tax=Streptomyces griseoluteus TaxID=29306 RepID=UPI003689C60E
MHLLRGVAGLVEFQTVHGSADDLEGRGLVNPVATIRAAAAVAERHVGCAGAVAAVEGALAGLATRGVCTADLGGSASTGEVVAGVLAGRGVPGEGADLAGRGWRTEVGTPYDHVRRYGRGPRPEPHDALAANRWVFAVKGAAGVSRW